MAVELNNTSFKTFFAFINVVSFYFAGRSTYLVTNLNLQKVLQWKKTQLMPRLFMRTLRKNS